MDYKINGFPVPDTGPNGGCSGGCLVMVFVVFVVFLWLLATILPYIVMGIIILIAAVLVFFLLRKMAPVWKRIIRMVATDLCRLGKWLYEKYWRPTERGV